MHHLDAEMAGSEPVRSAMSTPDVSLDAAYLNCRVATSRDPCEYRLSAVDGVRVAGDAP
jgi:hypothetical protein